MDKLYSIGEVANIFKISTNKVRFYEKKGLIIPKRDDENDYRYYTNNDLIKLQTILMYRELNLPVESIKDLFQDESKDNALNHFYTQWEVINSQVHKMKLVQSSLEKIMDNIYESEDDSYKERIIKTIESMNELWKIKNHWKDKWDFDSWARTYDNSIKNEIGILKFYRKYDELLDTVFSQSLEGKGYNSKILEIGVGTGNLARRYLEKDYNIIGIDQSREMLNVAKEKYPNLKLRLGDFLNIPYENNEFHVIVSTYAFHHLNEEEKRISIKEMLRVLKYNGRIVIGDLMFESKITKENMMKDFTKDQIEEIEDEYYSNIDFLKDEFIKYNKKIQVTKIDELVYIVTAE